ncbi:hypothetical protein M5K25_005232 [Dendrobium thyrsiflorum]|uniref:Uncharacterized protein n=1 Tax=Dendrobium thyrsiflorum TaxID=117978 RepID=A0ABD0VH40_DENTH
MKPHPQKARQPTEQEMTRKSERPSTEEMGRAGTQLNNNNVEGPGWYTLVARGPSKGIPKVVLHHCPELRSGLILPLSDEGSITLRRNTGGKFCFDAYRGTKRSFRVRITPNSSYTPALTTPKSSPPPHPTSSTPADASPALCLASLVATDEPYHSRSRSAISQVKLSFSATSRSHAPADAHQACELQPEASLSLWFANPASSPSLGSERSQGVRRQPLPDRAPGGTPHLLFASLLFAKARTKTGGLFPLPIRPPLSRRSLTPTSVPDPAAEVVFPLILPQPQSSPKFGLTTSSNHHNMCGLDRTLLPVVMGKSEKGMECLAEGVEHRNLKSILGEIS